MAILAICKGTKCYGTEMAECLARGLDYPIIGEEVVRDAAAELGVSAEDLQQHLGARPMLWDRFSAMRRTYLLALQAALADRVVEGNVVYHGLTGGLLLDDLPATLTLRCIAPMPMRVRAVVRESDMDEATAERYIRDIDAARSRWVKTIHDKEISDPGLYDLVVNLDNLTVGAACGMVRRMMRQPEYEVSDEVKGRLEAFRTTCHLKVALDQDDELRGLELDAEVDDGQALITGTVPARSSGKIGDRIAQTARSIPGVQDVTLEVEWFDPYP